MDNKNFTLIGRDDEKSKLWEDLAKAKGEILCKGKGDFICKLRIESYNPAAKVLECSTDSANSLLNQENYLGHFFLGGENYYFQATAQVQQGKFVVPLPPELYHLQRRQNYRVHIPTKSKSNFSIQFVNGLPKKINASLLDISSQGCRVAYRFDENPVKIGDSVAGSLVIEGRDPFEITGIVRHIKANEDNKSLQNIGVEFSPITPFLENKLFTITMEIYKQLFLRKS